MPRFAVGYPVSCSAPLQPGNWPATAVWQPFGRYLPVLAAGWVICGQMSDAAGRQHGGGRERRSGHVSSGMSEDEGGAFAPRGARRAALRSMSSEPKRASEPNPKAPHADDDKRGEVSR